MGILKRASRLEKGNLVHCQVETLFLLTLLCPFPKEFLELDSENMDRQGRTTLISPPHSPVFTEEAKKKNPQLQLSSGGLHIVEQRYPGLLACTFAPDWAGSKLPCGVPSGWVRQAPCLHVSLPALPQGAALGGMEPAQPGGAHSWLQSGPSLGGGEGELGQAPQVPHFGGPCRQWLTGPTTTTAFCGQSPPPHTHFLPPASVGGCHFHPPAPHTLRDSSGCSAGSPMWWARPG